MGPAYRVPIILSMCLLLAVAVGFCMSRFCECLYALAQRRKAEKKQRDEEERKRQKRRERQRERERRRREGQAEKESERLKGSSVEGTVLSGVSASDSSLSSGRVRPPLRIELPSSPDQDGTMKAATATAAASSHPTAEKQTRGAEDKEGQGLGMSAEERAEAVRIEVPLGDEDEKYADSNRTRECVGVGEGKVDEQRVTIHMVPGRLPTSKRKRSSNPKKTKGSGSGSDPTSSPSQSHSSCLPTVVI